MAAIEILSLGHSYYKRSWLPNAWVGGSFASGEQASLLNANQFSDFIDRNFDLYTLLTQSMLHADVEADPARPYLPHPDVFDRFVMACGIAYPNWVVDGGVADPNALAEGYWDNAPDRKKGWVYFIPEDTSFEAVVAQCFAWFKQYGPIPEDNETTDVAAFIGKSYPGGNDIVRERRVFYYAWETQTHGFQIRGIESGNLCCQIIGWNAKTSAWEFPRDWGTSIPVWMKRGPDDWRYFFNLNSWAEAHSAEIAQAQLAAMSSILAAYTGGATNAVLQVLVQGVQKLYLQAQTHATGGEVMLSLFQTSAQMIATANQQGAFANLKGEITKVAGEGAGKVVGWIEDVGKPFVSAYQKAQELLRAGNGVAKSFQSAAKLAGVSLPTVDDNFLEKALSSSVLGDVSYWAKKVVSLKDPKKIENFINSLPEYAKEAAGYGAMLASVRVYSKSSGYLNFSVLDAQKKTTYNVGIARQIVPMAKYLGKPLYQTGADTIGGVPNPGQAPQIISNPAKIAIGVTAASVLIFLAKDVALPHFLVKGASKVFG